MSKVVITAILSVLVISVSMVHYLYKLKVFQESQSNWMFQQPKAALYKLPGFRDYMHDFYKNDLDVFPN
jgi:hypothetical protein